MSASDLDSTPSPPRLAETPDPTWIALGGSGLVWHSWGSDHVVYHRGSGDTHCLDELSALILRRVASSPVSTEQLVAELAEAEGVAPDEVLRERVERALIRFHGLALVETLMR